MDITQINNKIPYDVKYILYGFILSGYETFIVGGCCRDILLNRTPNDYDICTNAKPSEIIKTVDILDYLNNSISLKTIPTGIKYGTITIMMDNKPFETTTFRKDGNYSDGRKPDNVTFATNIIDDLNRRDFTINAIAYSPSNSFIDPFNGITDINNKIIRCVGNPNERFNEDGLRILRAIRFAAQLGFTIEKETSKAIHDNKHLLKNISRERIQSELFKILSSNCCGNTILREYADVLCVCIPEIKPMIDFHQNNPYHCFDVWEHTLHCLYLFNNSNNSRSTDNIITRLTILLHDIGKPQCYTEDNKGIGHFYGHANISAFCAKNILKSLKCSNDIINDVCELIALHDVQFIPTKSVVKRLLNRIGETQLRRLLFVRLCDITGQNPTAKDWDNRCQKVFEMFEILDDVIQENECFKLKDLSINGKDLIEHGIPEGKTIGIILNTLLTMVIDGEIKNDKNKLLEMTDLIMSSNSKRGQRRKLGLYEDAKQTYK